MGDLAAPALTAAASDFVCRSALSLAVGASSYVYAAIVAGNPFLPLFNAYFRSPYFQLSDFDDTRWHAGFIALLPWKLTFDTGRYLEAFAGGGGFVLVALLGGWILAMTQRRTALTAVMMAVSIAIPLIPMQYLRYAFPASVMLLPLLAVMAFRIHPRRAGWLLGGVCLLNLAFQANGHWMLQDGRIEGGHRGARRRDASFRHYAPERILLAELRAAPPSAGNRARARSGHRPLGGDGHARLARHRTDDPSLAAARNRRQPAIPPAPPGSRCWRRKTSAKCCCAPRR